jgi:Protein of unknown function (DUF1573)
MRKLLPAMFVCLFFFGSAWTRGMLTKDFGTVARGSQFTHTFKVYNQYAATFELRTRVECNCVTVSPSVLIIQPKETKDLTITMDTTKFTGQKVVHIYVTLIGNGGAFRFEPTLIASAHIRGDVVLNPGQVNLGVVTSGQTVAPQTLDVDYAGAVDYQITGVETHNAPVDVTYKEQYRRPGRGGREVGYRLTVAVQPNASAGSFKQEIYLRTNDPNGPLLPIPIEVTVQASLRVNPPFIDVGSLKLGEEVEQKVILTGGAPFRITGVEGDGDGITVNKPSESSKSQILTLKYQAGKAGDINRVLQIKTDLPSEKAVKIRVEGAVKP